MLRACALKARGSSSNWARNHSSVTAYGTGTSHPEAGPAFQSFPISHFERLVKDTHLQHKIFVSNSRNAYLNLSIEHYLLQNSPPDSRILFFYTNAPSIVIGRNQNIWLETNVEDAIEKDFQIIRRRSGGGAVVHDEGNLNWSVICPPSEFTRDKHAEMVASTLRNLGATRARVNERHDIVLDRGADKAGNELSPVKVSGSAYKLTRNRALHHGTLLLSSDLDAIGGLLRSPASPFIKARGVESVRSRIENLSGDLRGQAPYQVRTEAAITREFASLYKIELPSRLPVFSQMAEENGDDQPSSTLDLLADFDTCLHVHDNVLMGCFPRVDIRQSNFELPDGVNQGVQEMMSDSWKYDQTPQFTFSSYPTEDDPRDRVLPPYLPSSSRVYLKVKHGAIIECDISFSTDQHQAETQRSIFRNRLLGLKLYQVFDWSIYLQEPSDTPDSNQGKLVGKWLDQTLGSTALRTKK